MAKKQYVEPFDFSQVKKPDNIPQDVWDRIFGAMQRTYNAAVKQNNSEYQATDPLDQDSDAKEWQDINDPVQHAWLNYWNNIKDYDAAATYYQQYLQYLLGEQNDARNYERSLAVNQAALMQQAGMSRAAALNALQGGSATDTSQTQISPQPTQMEQNRTNRMNAVMNVIQGTVQLANQVCALASAPFDLQAKAITNKILTNQGDMLEMQIQGMQDAAQFMQAVANQDANLRQGEKPVADMSINDQYAFFQQLSGKQFNAGTDKASSWMYANGGSFKRAASNPFFWATLNEQVRAKNLASASIYEPERAELFNANLRAAAIYTQNQSKTEKARARILGVQAFTDETLAYARREVERIKLECEKHGLQFDDERAQFFLKRAASFNQLDWLNLDYNIQRMSQMRDGEMYSKEVDAFGKSLDYQIASMFYQASLYSIKSGVLQGLATTGNDGVSMYADPEQENGLYDWTKSYLQFNELGNITEKNYNRGWINTVIGGLGTVFAGAGIIKGLQAARAATAGYTMSTTAGATAGAGSIFGTSAIPLMFLGLHGDTNSTYTQYVGTPPAGGEVALPMH